MNAASRNNVLRLLLVGSRGPFSHHLAPVAVEKSNSKVTLKLDCNQLNRFEFIQVHGLEETGSMCIKRREINLKK